MVQPQWKTAWRFLKNSQIELPHGRDTQSYLTPCDPRDCGWPAPPSMDFSRQEYWKALPFPSPGDFPNRGIKPKSPVLQADSLPSEPLLELPLDLAIPPLGNYPKELKGGSLRAICTSMFITTLFTIAKREKPPKCPLIDDRVNKRGIDTVECPSAW